jgi:hypothetical protein
VVEKVVIIVVVVVAVAVAVVIIVVVVIVIVVVIVVVAVVVVAGEMPLACIEPEIWAHTRWKMSGRGGGKGRRGHSS